jgi:hypothetical protein
VSRNDLRCGGHPAGGHQRRLGARLPLLHLGSQSASLVGGPRLWFCKATPVQGQECRIHVLAWACAMLQLQANNVIHVPRSKAVCLHTRMASTRTAHTCKRTQPHTYTHSHIQAYTHKRTHTPLIHNHAPLRRASCPARCPTSSTHSGPAPPSQASWPRPRTWATPSQTPGRTCQVGLRAAGILPSRRSSPLTPAPSAHTTRF